MKSSEREFFDRVAGIFDTRFNVYAKKTGKSRVRRRVHVFIEHCQFRQGMKILEIGCGTGEYSVGLSAGDHRLICTDISLNMLHIARSKLPRRDNLDFIHCDIERLPFRDCSFDAVVGNSILHHLDIGKALPELFRILKTGGRFAFSEPNMRNPQVFLERNISCIRRMSGNSPGETAFSRNDIRNDLIKIGFSSIEVTPFDFLYPYVPDAVSGLIEAIGRHLEKIPLIKEFAGSLLIKGVK
jgi:ubiquinone/menaquinone biosynthesis C-methylase UbiE